MSSLLPHFYRTSAELLPYFYDSTSTIEIVCQKYLSSDLSTLSSKKGSSISTYHIDIEKIPRLIYSTKLWSCYEEGVDFYATLFHARCKKSKKKNRASFEKVRCILYTVEGSPRMGVFRSSRQDDIKMIISLFSFCDSFSSALIVYVRCLCSCLQILEEGGIFILYHRIRDGVSSNKRCRFRDA